MLFLFYLIVFILEIFALIKGIKLKDNKYFKIFLGIFLGVLITLPLLRNFNFLSNINDLGTILIVMFLIFGYIFVYIILGIISLIIYFKSIKNRKLNDTSHKFTFISSLLLIILVFAMVVLCNSFMINSQEKRLNSRIEKRTVDYLESKYGNHNYDVIKIEEEYTYSGFNKHLSNYNVVVKNSATNKNVLVTIDADTNEYDDNLLNLYYENFDFYKDSNIQKSIGDEVEKLNAFLQKKVGVKLSLDSYDNDEYYPAISIPSDYGKIPTKKELYKLLSKYIIMNYLVITIDEDAIDNKLYSLNEAENVVKNIRFDDNSTYTLVDLTVYNEKKEIFKKYNSLSELLNNLNKDLMVVSQQSSIIMEDRLLEYYNEISKHIIKYYNNDLDWFLINCYYNYDENKYKVNNIYNGYIVITNKKIYMSTNNGSDIRNHHNLIDYYSQKTINK